MRSAWRIAKKDLLLRLRDRSALLVGFVVPLALAFIFNMIFGGAFSNDGLVTLGVADADGGDVALAFADVMDGLAEGGVVDVVRADDEAALRQMVEDGEVGAGILVPDGISAAVHSGEPAEMLVIGEIDRATSQSIAVAVADAFGAGVADVQRAVAATGALLGQPLDPAAAGGVTARAAGMSPVLTVEPVEAANRVLDPSTFFAASMAVFFVFFLVQFGVTGLLDEQREGTLTRLQAAPIPRWSVVVGKALTSFLLGVIAMAVMALATTLLMGANWGNPLGVAALIVAVSAAATSIIGVVAAFARTPEGAGNLVSVVAVAMGMLGGTFFPVAGGNRLIEVLSLATPHAWFMRGLGALSAGDGLDAIIGPLLGLAFFAIGVGVVATLLLRRRFA